MPPPAPSPPLPPPGQDPATKVVNVSVSLGYALGFAARASPSVEGRTEFALCYETTAEAALACAEAAAAADGGAEKEMAKRNACKLGFFSFCVRSCGQLA